MYCPVCGAEYRADFTFCSDCQVDLVSDLPEDDAAKNGASDQSGSFSLIWSGTDARVHADVVDALNREKIPSRTLRDQDHLVYASASPPFEVYVPSDLAAKAQQALKATDTVEESSLAESGALELPAEDDEPDGNQQRGSARRYGSKYANVPADAADLATAMVWTGDDFDVAGMIEASLRENAIYCRIASGADARTEEGDAPPQPDGATEAIFVFPEDEARAKEIIREITDATAPPK